MRTPLITPREPCFLFGPLSCSRLRGCSTLKAVSSSLCLQWGRGLKAPPGRSVSSPTPGVSDTWGPCISGCPVAPTFIRNLNKGRGGRLECSFCQGGCMEKRGSFKRLHLPQSPQNKERNPKVEDSRHQACCCFCFLFPDLYDLKKKQENPLFATEAKINVQLLLFISSIHISQIEWPKVCAGARFKCALEFLHGFWKGITSDSFSSQNKMTIVYKTILLSRTSVWRLPDTHRYHCLHLKLCRVAVNLSGRGEVLLTFARKGSY